MSGHTPLPWGVNPSRTVAGCNGDVAIVNKDNSIVAVAFLRSGSTEAALANAEFIVRACNAHGEMLDALCGVVTYFAEGDPSEDFQPLMEQVAAAIAKAEGK